MADQIITDKIYNQIMEIREWGGRNMLDTIAIQREAYNRELYELVLLIEENRIAYVDFIMYGKR